MWADGPAATALPRSPTADSTKLRGHLHRTPPAFCTLVARSHIRVVVGADTPFFKDKLEAIQKRGLDEAVSIRSLISNLLR